MKNPKRLVFKQKQCVESRTTKLQLARILKQHVKQGLLCIKLFEPKTLNNIETTFEPKTLSNLYSLFNQVPSTWKTDGDYRFLAAFLSRNRGTWHQLQWIVSRFSANHVPWCWVYPMWSTGTGIFAYILPWFFSQMQAYIHTIQGSYGYWHLYKLFAMFFSRWAPTRYNWGYFTPW